MQVNENLLTAILIYTDMSVHTHKKVAQGNRLETIYLNKNRIMC
jgi:hypothetical protein